MLTTLTIPHRTLGQLHSRDEMKVLLSASEIEHVYDTIPPPPGPLAGWVSAASVWLRIRLLHN